MLPEIERLAMTVAVVLLASHAPLGATDPGPRPDLRDPGWELAGAGAAVEGVDGELEPKAGDAPGQAISGLSWLAGCWQGEGGEECWLAPRGGLMIAVNRAPARQGKLPFFELLRIVEEEEGLVFLAQPNGRSPATPFRAVEVGDRRIVFANPEHDFPQRITYWREGPNLRVRVEALKDGEWGGFEQSWSPGSWPGE